MFVLIGITEGGQAWGGGWLPDTQTPVGLFMKRKNAIKYIEKARLKNPNYSKSQIFKKSSTLDGFDRAKITTTEIHILDYEVDDTLKNIQDAAATSHYWR